MKRKELGLLISRITTFTLIFMLTISTIAFAQEGDVAQANAVRFGVWTLLPPLVAIVLAFITKNVIFSLFIGVLTGTFMLNLNGFNIISALCNGLMSLINRLLTSLADPWNAGIILQCLTIGGLIALVTKMGGAKAVAESLSKKAKGPRSAQLITWVLGLLVFFDDYANSLIVGPIMRPVTDKMKIAREKLAFIVDGTAAPISGIALISTWVGYEISVIREGYEQIGVQANAYGVFTETIPYRFYNILIMVFIVCTIFMLKEFGPMLKAQRRAHRTGMVSEPGADVMDDEETKELAPQEGTRLSIWDAVIPIGTLVVTAFAGFYYSGRDIIVGGGDAVAIKLFEDAPFSFTAIREAFGASDASLVLFQAAVIACIVAIIMGVSKRTFTLKQSIDVWLKGVNSLIITGVILLLAWSLSSVIKELGTAKYLTALLASSMPKFLLPSVIFVFGAVISFATGTSYGTMGILMPLAIPLAHAVCPEHSYVVLAISAVLTGAIFGDHCSPISDTTILSSMGSSCDHIDHIKTQLWYALPVALITIVFGYIPSAFGVPIYIVLPVSFLSIAALVFFVGRPIADK